MVKKAQNKEHLLYIGRNYNSFLKEALKKGISRNIPLNQGKSVRWGDRVYCSVHEKYQAGSQKLYNGNYPTEIAAILDVLRGLGRAKLICSFRVSKLFVKDPEIMARFLMDGEVQGKIKEVEDYTDGGSTAGKEVNRDCGSYSISAGVTVDMDTEEIMEKFDEIIKKEYKTQTILENLAGNSFKWQKLERPRIMIGGKVEQVFKNGETIENIKFSRGLKNLKKEVELERMDKKEVDIVTDYKQFKTKKDRMEAIERRLGNLDNMFGKPTL